MVHCTVVACRFSLPWWGIHTYVYMVMVDTLGSTEMYMYDTIGGTVPFLRTYAYTVHVYSTLPIPWCHCTSLIQTAKSFTWSITETAQTPYKEANKIHCRRLHTTSLGIGCQATNLFKLVRHKPCFGNLIWNTQSKLVQQVERNYKYGTNPHASSHNIQRCS